MSTQPPKIAILGFSLETNGFSPPSTRADFEQIYLLRGAELEADIRSEHPRANGTLPGFVREMNASGDWTMAPLLVAVPSTTPTLLREKKVGIFAAAVVVVGAVTRPLQLLLRRRRGGVKAGECRPRRCCGGPCRTTAPGVPRH